MKENKKVSPSWGVCGRLNAAAKSKPISLTGIGFSQSVLRLLLVLLVLPMAWVNAWGYAGYGAHYISAKTAAPAQGLVYMSGSNEANVADSKFKNTYPGGSLSGAGNESCYTNNGSSGCTPKNRFFWARPSRGFVFSGSWGTRGTDYAAVPASKGAVGTACDVNQQLNQGPFDGIADIIQTTAGGGSATYKRPIANFTPATKYVITYAVPVGGSYSVHYGYIESYDTGETESTDGTAIWRFRNAAENYEMTPSSEENKPVDSYAADTIILTVPTLATNFIGWYENGVKKSENKTYVYTAHADVIIKAEFKELAWGDVTGDLTITENASDAKTRDEDNPHNGIIYVAIPTLIGSWESSDFTVTPMSTSNSFGSIAIGTIALDKPNSRLVIPYTYTATNWGGVEANLTITPSFGATKEISITCSAEEKVNYEACIEVNKERVETGYLVDMINIANGNTYENPVVKLMNNKTITAPLSFTNSFTFDVNGNVLTANCASAFSINAAGVDVQIIDGSFTQVGEIHTSHSSSGNVNVVTFSQAAKLTMQGGTLSATNTGSGSAYGVDVQQGSIFYMTGGDLTVTANTGNAQGVHVATANDYATFNGGSIAVSAPTNAYGLWSAGQSNITNTLITVETTTGADAYGAYVNGGVSTITTTDITTNAKTANAYGAYVNAGRLNFNGGKLTVKAVESGVYGLHIAGLATAILQQNAKVTAEATGVSGSNVVGINNLGTVSLNKITVTATSPTDNAKAINTAVSAVLTTIEDGSYTANAETGMAYGVHHQYGKLNADGAIFRGIVKTSGTDAYGVCVAADAKISNATLLGETRGSATTAYGFKGDAVGAIDTLMNSTVTGLSVKNKAYAIYTKANVAAINCTLTATTSGSDNANDGAEAYGMYAENGTNALTNCNTTVTSNTIKAYGVNHLAGSLTVTDGTYIVKAKQATASLDENANLYGLYNASGLTSIVNGAEFQVTATNDAKSQYAYGAYINGTLHSSGATYNVTARRYVYGLQGMGGSNLGLTNNSIRVEATNTTTTNSNSSWSYGIYAKKDFSINGDKVDAIGYVKEVYALFFDASTSNGDVLDGKFSAQGNGTNNYGCINAAGTAANVRLKGGIYTSSINLAKYAYTDYEVYNLDGTHPDYANGYRYVIAMENPSPYVCYIVGGAYYSSLKDALQYTLDNSGSNHTIVMTQSHTLPAGNYVLPQKATLIIPRKFDQTTITERQASNPALPDMRNTAGLRENFLCLTMANGANLNVNGKIGVSGELYCVESGRSSYNNSPYGRIHMESGSHIQLNSGAYLYAWGFITGAGTITVKSNAEVHEMFQVGDMKPASHIGNNYNDNPEKFFFVNQYCIQNIEVPTTYYYNSRLIGSLRCYYNGLGGVWYGDDNIKVIGTSGALFEVTTNDESAWVRKSYDAEHDYQVWDVNSKAQLGSISITMDLPIVGERSFNSSNYILPITSNMKIHILDGDFAITQNAELLPGSSIEIDKTASLTVNANKKLYVFDKDQWPLTTADCTPAYSLSWPNGSKPSRTAGDAAINVHGSIYANGAIYTTQSISNGTNATNGANIYSNNVDAGTIAFETAAPSTTTSIELITSIDTNGKVKRTVTMDPALLRNGDNSTTATSATAKDHAFAYIDGIWTETYKDECFETIGEHVYVKPSDYVELKKQREEEGDYEDLYIRDNHTYLSIDETRVFIHVLDAEGNCQWWEVAETSDPTVFECEKPGYEGFYYYDTSGELWKLKTVNVTFYMKETGTDSKDKVVTINYNGIPDQSVIASNPTKATTAEATYQFYGWKSSVTGTEYPWTASLEVAKADMSYRPVFTETKRNYTVTLVDAYNGANVPLEVPYGETPEYTPVKNANEQYTYTFDHWEPALAPVTGSGASYTAQWNNIVNRYTITWKDGETVLETDKHLLYGATTSFDGTLPTKEPDNNFVYAFSGWRSSLTGQTYANGSTPTVAGETTYEAQFSTTPRYKVTFANYDGKELYHEFVKQGEHPVYNGLTPGRVRDLDGYFKFIGWKNSDGTDFAPNATLPVVTGKETYTAQYDYVTELYWITLHNVTGKNDLTDDDDNWSGKFGVGSTPFYDPNNDDVADMPTKAGNAQYSYPFTGWTPALQPVSGEATYTAQFGQEINSYDITFANLDGVGASQTIKVEYGQTPVCPVTPTKDDGINSYPFTGWKNSNGDDYAPDATLPAVAGEETYTATFSSTPIVRQFDITFDLDNGSPVTIVPVTYDETPIWTGETPTKPATAQYTYTFAGWYPEFAPVTGEETYIAQYTQTLNSYTVTFMDRGETLLSSSFQYGTTPTKPAEPKAYVDEANNQAYSFAGWSDGEHVYALNAIPTVTGDVTYTAQYTEFANLVATVTTSAGVTTPYNSWDGAFGAANGSANCTLKLYKNVTVSIYQTINWNMTIDLNGFEIKRESGNTLFTFSDIALTINDSKGGGRIYLNSNNSNNPIRAVAVAGNGSVTINGGTIEAYSTYNSNNAIATPIFLNSANATLYLYDGELISNTSRSGAKAYAVYNNSTSNGYSYIYGGKLHTKTGIFYNGTANRLTIQGGYYNINTNLNTNNFVKAPYYIFNTTGEDKAEVGSDYDYKVAEAYTITFNNWDNSNLSTLQKQIVGSTPAYSGATPTKPQDDQYTYAHSGWTPAIVPVEANATYTATFTGTYRDYTITWQDLDGTSLGTTQVLYDNATRPTHDAPTHADPYCSFIGWKAASNGVTYAADELPYVGVNALAETYTAQYECNYPEIVIDEHETETIAINTETSTTTIHTDGTLNVADGVTLTTTNLILEASESASGQIIENGSIAATNVYYDLYLNTDARHWHAFGVPWAVNLTENPLTEVESGRTLNISRDYEIMYYDGAERAANGPGTNCWKYLRHYDEAGQPIEELVPGKGYMIAFGSHVNTVRFVKKAGEPIIYDGSVTVQAEGSGADRGINAIANPMAYHANMTLSVHGEGGVGYVHDGGLIGEDEYNEVTIAGLNYIVGKTVYVQVDDEQTISVANSKISPAAAPARRAAKATDKKYMVLEDYYTVSFTSVNGGKVAKVYVLPEEDKEDAYFIGHDLVKMGMSDKKAQIWVKRYDVNLGLNTTAPINEVAGFPINLYAPTAGEYTISLASQPDDEYTVYLTLNSEAIWNLSETPYALSLNAGTQNNYGLRLTANHHSPAVTTGIDEAVVDAQGETRKVIIEDKVYIIRGNNVYSVDGQLVK